MTNLVPICCDGIDIKYLGIKKKQKKTGKTGRKKELLFFLGLYTRQIAGGQCDHPLTLN